MSEQERIEAVIAEAGLPDFVHDVACTLDVDATGDPAVWIWVILSDEKTQGDAFAESTEQIRELIWTAFNKAQIARWPYIRFRSASEQAVLGTGG